MFDGPIRPIRPVRAITALRAVRLSSRPTGAQLSLVRRLGKRYAARKKDQASDEPDPPSP